MIVDQEGDLLSSATATFSDDRRYRYVLTRTWPGGDSGTVNWIMLNPSTADSLKLDPTLRRCLAWSIGWGYTQMVVTNIFALRSTDPRALYEADNPVGPNNDWTIIDQACTADLVVAGWGIHGELHNRAQHVRRMLADERIHLHALALTKAGHPGHPLYLPGAALPRPLPL